MYIYQSFSYLNKYVYFVYNIEKLGLLLKYTLRALRMIVADI